MLGKDEREEIRGSERETDRQTDIQTETLGGREREKRRV